MPQYKTEVEAGTRGFFRIRGDGTASHSGVEHGELTVKALSREGFIVHEKGGTHWAGRGSQAYHGAEIAAYVWECVKVDGNDIVGWAIPVAGQRVRDSIFPRFLNLHASLEAEGENYDKQATLS